MTHFQGFNNKLRKHFTGTFHTKLELVIEKQLGLYLLEIV